jgi:hypothetical protein
MELIELYDEISVQSLLRVSKLVIVLDLHWNEYSDTLSIVITNKTFLCVRVVNEPFQEFYAGKN